MTSEDRERCQELAVKIACAIADGYEKRDMNLTEAAMRLLTVLILENESAHLYLDKHSYAPPRSDEQGNLTYRIHEAIERQALLVEHRLAQN